MSQIPGEYLSPARYWLPRPETSGDSTYQLQCAVPRLGAVQITYRRMTHKHGRMRSWYWTPVQAEIVRDQA